MKKLALKLLILGLLLNLSLIPAHAQDKKEQIAKVINDYFFLERENIHVHLDKNVFLSNESIWFKGYIYHRKHNIPFYSCINIFASLIDEKGNIVETKLLYGDLGCFTGSFTLNENFKSGKYYLQFYTNWMNNFTEDESAVYEVTVINEVMGIPESLTAEYTDVNITLHPEGGTLLQGTHNIVGVSVLNCNNEPTKATDAEIIDSNGISLKKIPLNKAGYGKFDLNPSTGENYRIVVSIDGTKHEQSLIAPQARGFTIEANSFTLADKTSIKIRSNKSTIDSYAGKPLYIAVHKDEKSVIFNLNFDNGSTEQSITLLNRELFEGLNTIRILDPNLQQIAERLIYIYPSTGINSQLSKGKNNDGQIELSGTVTKPNMNLSITVLPAESLSLDEENDILGGLLLYPYLKNNQKLSARNYLNNFTRGGKYELDLFLMNQESKYNWNDIMNKPPKQSYTFEMGLEVKGTINQTIKSPKDYKVRIQSFESMIDETVPLNDKKEFSLQNLILRDSTSLKFTLLKNGEKPVTLKVYPQIFNNLRKFNRPFKPTITQCSGIATNSDTKTELPKFITNSITLDEIQIEGKKTKLKHEKAYGNSQLRAYKISESDGKSFFYILDFIRYHGFNVTNSKGEVSITGRNITSINGQATEPMIYIDDMRVLDYSQLIGIYTEDVDEFYVNQHAIVPSVDNKMGIIRIYMKKSFGPKKIINSEVSFLIKNGFETPAQFKNAEYFSTHNNEGFENFGIIDWQSNITTDDKGNFNVNIPNIYSGDVKIIIEGISPDGKLISEIKTITL